MIQDNKWGQLFVRIITILFTVIISVLTFMSFFEHSIADIDTYGYPRFVEPHRPIIYIGMAGIGIILLVCVCHLVSKVLDKSNNSWKTVHKFLMVATGIMSAACIFWIFFNDATPKFDQEILFNEAKIIAGYEKGEFNTTYFEFYPRNKILVLVMALMLRIFGDSMISFRILNVVGAVVLLLAVTFSTKKIWKQEGVTIITGLFLMAYYPIVIYTGYLYGTLLSAAFGALGVYGTVSFCGDKKWKYIVISILSFPFAIQMHQSATIMMIAAMFYMLLYISKKTFWQTLVCYGMFLIMLFASNKIGDIIYEDIVGVELGEAVPTLADIYMGISAVGGYGGPGSQNNSNVKIFMENNCDPEATSKDAWNRIKKIILEYMSGERELSFFVEKTKFQWLDPTFGSRRIIEANYVENGEPPNSEAYLKVRNSRWRNVGFKISVVGLIIVYSLNLFTVVYQLVKKEHDGLHFFIRILLIGGFIFQLLWESISRYCFSYYIWLLPGAAYGVMVLYKVILCYYKEKGRCIYGKGK